MSHLGDLAAALADSEMSPDARDRALAHLAGCAECHADVDVQRRLRALLANQSDPAPAAGFLARLRDIPVDANSTAAGTPYVADPAAAGGPRPVGVPVGLRGSATGPTRSWFPAAAASFAPASTRPASGTGSVRPDVARTDPARTDSLRTDSLRTDSLRTDSLRTDSLRTDSLRSAPTRPVRRRTLRRIVAGSASAFALTVALAALGGSGESGSPPPVTPPVDRFLQTHTVMNGRLPLGDPGAGVVESVTLVR